MRGRRAAAAAALASAALSAMALLAACNGIIGVEDVRLRKDSGATDLGDDPGDPDEGGPAETGPRPQENVLEVALGLSHTCARKPDLSVKCWGDDRSGQLGTGGMTDGGVAAPQPVGITDAIRIAAGKNHTCVVRSSGKVSCWGDNQDGQIGNGKTNARSLVPEDVSGLSDAVQIACGAAFSCAVRAAGSVVCWGSGLAGQLGNGARQIQPTPVAVSNLDRVVALSAGESHACAVRDDGALVCWGDGFDGQLGNGDQKDRLTPTPVTALDDVTIVAAAARSTCAVKNGGAVYCWGENSLGQLGSGAANPTPNPSPTVVTNLDAVALWAGADHACAVKRGGAVACWGAGFQGQIGDGQSRAAATTPTPSPSGVLGVTSAIKIGTGGNHSCATTKNTILCWGENDRGQLGTGAAGTPLLSPESVVGYP
jgi:alpha-tubulin suppressor-like RCC1 family protein